MYMGQTIDILAVRDFQGILNGLLETFQGLLTFQELNESFWEFWALYFKIGNLRPKTVHLCGNCPIVFNVYDIDPGLRVTLKNQSNILL